MSVFPNPANDKIKVHFIQQESGFLRLWDMSGRLLLTKLVKREKEVDLSVFNYSSGIYFLHFQSEDGRKEYRKLMID